VNKTQARAADDALRLARARQLAASGEGERIRREAKLSHGSVGAAIGVADITVIRWERGDRCPSGPGALIYADFIDALRQVVES
jgi:DNA-binding transcriptional regulator YiaG